MCGVVGPPVPALPLLIPWEFCAACGERWCCCCCCDDEGSGGGGREEDDVPGIIPPPAAYKTDGCCEGGWDCGRGLQESGCGGNRDPLSTEDTEAGGGTEDRAALAL